MRVHFRKAQSIGFRALCGSSTDTDNRLMTRAEAERLLSFSPAGETDPWEGIIEEGVSEMCPMCLSFGPSIRYIDHLPSWASALRGKPFFIDLKASFNSLVGSEGSRTVHISRPGDQITIPPRTPEILFISMPGMPDLDSPMLKVLKAYSLYEHCALIVDVTADVFGVMKPTSDMYAAHQQTSTEESKDFWTQPVVLDNFARALELATIITTPWKDLTGPLGEFTDCPVMHLPDCHKDDAMETFGTGFAYVLERLKGHPTKRSLYPAIS